MKTRKLWRSLRAVLAIVGIAGCASDPTSPAPVSGASPNLVGGLLGSLTTVNALTRITPLNKDVSVSAVIGKAGGTIRIPEAGFTLTVPKNAVKSPTTFTVTAVKGKLVAYEFEPHGTQFSHKPVAEQDLRVTNWNGRLLPLLKAAYFADRSQLDLKNLTAEVSEIISGLLQPLTGKFRWDIPHYSGYIVCW